jgi:hypothetical protein
VDELELYSDLGKSICVTTTVTNTQSLLPGRNRDACNSSKSERALKGEHKWGADLDTHGVEDVGSCTVIEAEVAV